MTPPLFTLRKAKAWRLIPSRFPTAGVLDRIAAPEDLEAVFELESWTNDRVANEMGVLLRVPREEWVIGKPMASVVMAAFCHPRPGGGRFNSQDRGAWYAAFSLQTAIAETAYHRTTELEEAGIGDARLEMRLYTCEFDAAFHDIRAAVPRYRRYHDPASYIASQALAEELLAKDSTGLLYRSVRNPGGECVACFRPKAVRNVRIGGHFAYRFREGALDSVETLGRARP